MSITRKDIEYIAHLARLEVSEEEIPAYTDKLDKIIGFIDALESADTGDLVPMAHPLDMAQRLRADAVTESDQRDRFQKNATETQDGLYVVPRVVE
ncbi:MAG: Asp-tRNA(Asn)/Glu-tRNA(Gln) amidotransferase subunit GatC [Gammaproteobacteria bacterium]|nr:Asp-tRNA(Asn)/Glu-tRNA(Gln) amidotransferase subunit GatC [Gammaproteobacteria bacterium]